MKKLALGTIVLLSACLVGCFLDPATSEFFVDNQSSYDLVLSYTGVDAADTGTLTITAGTRASIGSKSMIETDATVPSFVYTKVTAALASNPAVPVYAQDPVTDPVWSRVSGDRAKQFVYTLVLADADLSIP